MTLPADRLAWFAEDPGALVAIGPDEERRSWRSPGVVEGPTLHVATPRARATIRVLIRATVAWISLASNRSRSTDVDQTCRPGVKVTQ